MGKGDIVIQPIPHDDWSWLPPGSKSLEEAFRMGAKPPRQMTRGEFEAAYPSEPKANGP